MPSGSGYLSWLDDVLATERPDYGFPDDAVEWAEQSGLPPSTAPYLAQQLGGTRGKGREGGFSHEPVPGVEVVVLSRLMPARLQSPPRYSPLFEEHYEDEQLYRAACERFDDETVVKWTSFVVIPGETPAQVVDRVARLHVRPHGRLAQPCQFSGPDAVRPYGDFDYRPKRSKHPHFHAADMFVLFRRGSVVYAVAVCDDCAYGPLVKEHRPGPDGWPVGEPEGPRKGGGLAEHLARHGERVVAVDYWTDRTRYASDD